MLRFFFTMRRYLKESKAQPDSGLLENVGSVLSKSRTQVAPAADLIMSGIAKKPEGKKDFKYGLKYIRQYWWKMFGPLAGQTVGLHFERQRCFWLLLRKGKYTEENLQSWHDNAVYLASRAIRPTPLAHHFDDGPPQATLSALFASDCDSDSDEGPAETAGPVTKKRRIALENTAGAFRKTHGLAKFGSAEGHPYSSTAPDHIRQRLSPRELDVIDSAFLYLQKFTGNIPDTLAIDVSQSPSRMPWRTNGNLPSPCKRSLIWYNGRVLDAPTMFSLMGWPRSSLQLPKLKEAEIRTLIGNMCTPPQAGLLIASFLAINPAFKKQRVAV